MERTDEFFDTKWQKICTSEDYLDSDFQDVIKNVFNQSPTYHRKQWEFVVIYLNLLNHGKLNKNSIGASFGAGRERLIFDVSKKVKKLIATDLYVYNTAWATAKVEKGMSCYDFVLEKAPKEFDASTLEVLEMDMRSLNFEDNSLDFCYSSCAFEHIGHFKDFVKHLKEAKRVLNNGGVYVMTTEHLFAHKTIEIKGNYKFDFDYLLEVFKAADFFPEPEFDARLSKAFLNKPKPDILALNGFTERMLIFFPSLVISRHGVPYTSSCFVFKKDDKAQAKTLMLHNSSTTNAFLLNNIRNNVAVTYQQYQSLDPAVNMKKEGRTALMDHIEYLSDDFDNFVDLYPVDLSHFAYTDFIYFDDFDCKFLIKLNFEKLTKIRMELIERSQSKMGGRVCIQNKVKEISGFSNVTFDFKAQKNKVYAIALYATDHSRLLITHIEIKAKIII